MLGTAAESARRRQETPYPGFSAVRRFERLLLSILRTLGGDKELPISLLTVMNAGQDENARRKQGTLYLYDSLGREASSAAKLLGS